MKYLSWVKSNSEYGVPPAALTDAIAQSGAEQFASGKMLDAGGLSTLREGGAKVSLTGGKITDGPYSEAKELVGGYAIQNHASLDEAKAGAVWMLELHKQHWPEWEGEIEIRQMFGPEDF
ncbi:YciI family protein [Antrihabitans cavernicola]|uniref:Uncharacterized protein n=1 Tax=Antrihabitans cavernicola TaxID=2495913 RepID=A0A5A7S7B6_9NOCA|nr:YciI family protein [Spelaeibacter cavernicola]KAA0021069.1 hypothetical protein FOY51_20835 [Spelaeibacter cavernicola]